MKEKAFLSGRLEKLEKLRNALSDNIELLEMIENEEELSEIAGDLINLEKLLEDIEFLRMLGKEEDRLNAILSINSGAGGTESQDWANMLLRMYTRYAERMGFQVEIYDFQNGDEAGIKSATLNIKGEHGFGYLKAEVGVHRLVRISPFDSNARRHTSFASVYVMPEYDDNIEVDIKEADLKIDTYRASGAGGQHVNKTDSAVRITHLPTGIVVQCQNNRSQHQNKATCMKLLKGKLYEEERQKREEEIAAKGSEKKEIGWGSQIRSYVMQPYQMVKDLRTGTQSSNGQAVMDGDIHEFIVDYLMGKKRDKNDKD